MSLKRSVLTVAGCAMGLALIAATDLLALGRSNSLRVAGLFALFGLFMGTILVTDPVGGQTERDLPWVRTLVGLLVGALYALTLNLSAPFGVGLTLVLGLLGYFGMRWARYVEF